MTTENVVSMIHTGISNLSIFDNFVVSCIETRVLKCDIFVTVLFGSVSINTDNVWSTTGVYFRCLTVCGLYEGSLYCVQNTEPVLFADDTNCFSSGSNAISLHDGVNNDLATIAEWLKVNELSLNIKKTYYMCLSTKYNTTPCISRQMCGKPIVEVFKSTFLGVIINNELSWKDHVSFVCRKVAHGIGVIIKARKVLHSESLKCLYYPFIYPYMMFCNQVWVSAYKTNIKPLFILQKRVVRIILRVCPRSPSEPLFTTLKSLNCKNIFIYLIGRLMHKVYHGELRVFHCLFLEKRAIYMYTIPVRRAIIITHCFKLTWVSVVWDMLLFLCGTTFLALISIQTSASLFFSGVLKSQYVIT